MLNWFSIVHLRLSKFSRMLKDRNQWCSKYSTEQTSKQTSTLPPWKLKWKHKTLIISILKPTETSTSTWKVQTYENTHKLVSLLTVAEQGTFVLLLVLDKRLQDDQDHYYEDADNTVLMMKKMMTWMSTLKPSLDGHSADCVASSHFSKSKARRGKRGCL